ncbi:SDR family NAD(P)-dependent oxidoreductase [Rhodobacteraceae bacterium CCMM004]|nr:SDR family NAD(P)-dependent oxidoreductase [Rhodobacteraceae bacterium CCMM004]
MERAIVLGGTAGVGRAVVDKLVARGARVGVVARGTARLDALREAYPGHVATAAADVADAQALATAVDTLVAEIGAPDAWVNDAMATVFSPFSEVTAEEFQRVVDVTLMGQVNGTREALRVMPHGRIVCVGSGLAYRSVPFQSAYCAAKHGINGFVSSLRSELIRDNAPHSLHLVQLPAINTPQFDWARNRMSEKPQPAPPIFSPEVAADAVMRALDDGPRELLVGKSVMQLVFGNFALPDWLDRKLAKEGVGAQKSGRPAEGGEDNLFSPADYPARATGSYGDRASDKAWVVDGDLARKVAFFGIPAAAFLLGLIFG